MATTHEQLESIGYASEPEYDYEVSRAEVLADPEYHEWLAASLEANAREERRIAAELRSRDTAGWLAANGLAELPY